ncbi:hypothetical protein BSKO_05049 [Bryopsis sp. KO-2023]|nr:hypothetical protein BSKO_05049 [Bryopsis sp. KO-2023]
MFSTEVIPVIEEGPPPKPSKSPTPQGPSTPTSKLASRASVQSDARLIAGRYVLGQGLGRGAHGFVYEAMDKKSGKFVAVKEISLAGVSKENLKSVKGEIELLKDLKHKNIVQYYDSEETRNHLYIILEFMENGSLANVIDPSNFGAFPENLVSVYIAQVLEGLRYLHSQGVVHRDIKGANILTTKEGLVKLADFGVAAKLQDKGTMNGLQGDYHNTVAGTPYWMAPEVIELTSVTPAADIWSLGCLVIELLTGAPPYFDCQPFQALYRIVQDDCPPLPHPISPLLEDFLMGCFQKEPSGRMTAEELLQHDWINHHRMTLRASWNRNKGMKQGGNETSRASVSVVVDRILQHQALQQNGSNQDHDQVPTPEIAESPIGIFRTGSAPVSPVDGASGRPPLPSDDHQLPSTSAGFPEDSKSWAGQPLSNQNQNHSMTAGEGPNGTRNPPENGVNRRRRPPGQSMEEVLVEFDSEPRLNPQVDAIGGAASDWLGTEINGAGGRHVPLATVVFSQYSRGDDVNGQTRHVDPLSTAALYNTVGSQQWNTNLDTMMSTQRLGVDVDRQEQIKMRRLVNCLRPHLPSNEVAHAATRLVVEINAIPEKKALFLAEGGVITIMELLSSTDLKVIEVTLELIVVMCDKDLKILESMCMVGLAPTVFRFSSSAFTTPIRKHAATFMEMLCFSSMGTLELFVACQGIHWIGGLFEDNSTMLTSVGLLLVEKIIKAHTAQVTNSICRLFAASNLPHRLVMSLVGMIQSLKENASPRHLLSGSEMENMSQSAFLTSIPDISEQSLPHVGEANHEPHHAATRSTGSNPSTSGASDGLISSRPPTGSAPLLQLADKAASLLLMLSTCDTVVRARLCPKETLKSLLEEVRGCSRYPSLQFKVVKALKNVSLDPELLDRLQGADTIRHLVPLLDKDRKIEVRREVLQLMLNLCKMNPRRCEIAAKEGIIPHLYRLTSQRAENYSTNEEREVRSDMRRMSVDVLCNMLTVSNAEIREKLWKHDILNLFLQIVMEDQWQAKVLDGLAVWLEEDIHQVEPKLILKDSIHLLISILQNYRQRMNEVSQVLEPIVRMLVRSDRVSRQMGQLDLAPVLVDMLWMADAATCLKLLKAMMRIYAMHPRPKEFIKGYDVQRHLKKLASPNGGQVGESRVLVRKQAGELLRAFEMNQIW